MKRHFKPYRTDTRLVQFFAYLFFQADNSLFSEKNALDIGLGAVLLQEFESEGRLPIAYASNKLLHWETKYMYSVIENECLGIIWGVETFRKYPYGVEFLLETDHKPLFCMQIAKVLNPRLMRWAMKLQPYRFRIVAIRGRDNLVVDYLSR